MNQHTLTLLDQIFREGRDCDATEPSHSKRYLNLEPDTARLLNILIRSTRRASILEIGTSSGYSTIWLADALRTTGGRLTTIDRDPAKQAIAARNLERAGLRDLVDLISGDATAAVADLPGPFDMVFFDADRTSAPAQLAILIPRLAPDVLLLADNALSHPEEIAGYLAAVEALPDFESITIPIGKGLNLAYRQSPG